MSIEGAEGTITIEGRVLEVESRGATERVDLDSSLSEGSHHPEWFAGTAAEFLAEISHPELPGRSLAESAVCLEVIRLAQASDRLGGAMLSAGPASASAYVAPFEDEESGASSASGGGGSRGRRA